MAGKVRRRVLRWVFLQYPAPGEMHIQRAVRKIRRIQREPAQIKDGKIVLI